MKGTDFFKNLTETLGVTIPEETLTKLNEIELPDEVQAKHKEIFISKERAKNDPDIIDHVTKDIRREHFRIMDEKIKTFLPMVSTDHQNVINNTFETYKKYDILKTALEDAHKNVKGKVSEDVRKVEDEWATKMKGVEENHKKELEAHAQKNKEMQLEFVIKSKLLGYNFSEAFQPVKEHLTQMAIIDLKSKPYQYELENGAVAIRQEKDGVKRDVFEPGTENKLTLEKLLDTFVDPFIAKSNGGKKEDPKVDSGNPQPPINNGQGLSHLDRMRVAAQ
jgi:hypothetical protein